MDRINFKEFLFLISIGLLIFSLGIALGDIEFSGNGKEKKSKSRLLSLIGNFIGGASIFNTWSTCYGKG